jgi:hypothetical protein
LEFADSADILSLHTGYRRPSFTERERPFTSGLEKFLEDGERVRWQGRTRVSDEVSGHRHLRIGCVLTIGACIFLFGLFVVDDVMPYITSSSTSGFSLVSFGLLVLILLWVSLFFGLFAGARVMRRSNAKLREWYSDEELSNYVQFLAITDKHIIKKSREVAIPSNLPGLPFLGNVEAGPAQDPQWSTPMATGPAIVTEKDVQIMDIGALARIQKQKAYHSYVLILSFTNSNSSLLRGTPNFAARASILVKGADTDEVIALLRSINPSVIVEDWHFQRPAGSRKNGYKINFMD